MPADAEETHQGNTASLARHISFRKKRAYRRIWPHLSQECMMKQRLLWVWREGQRDLSLKLRFIKQFNSSHVQGVPLSLRHNKMQVSKIAALAPFPTHWDVWSHGTSFFTQCFGFFIVWIKTKPTLLQWFLKTQIPGKSVSLFRHGVEENEARVYGSNVFGNLVNRDTGRRQKGIEVPTKG